MPRVVLPSYILETHDGLLYSRSLTYLTTSQEGYPLHSIEEVDEVIEDSVNWGNLSGGDNANNVANEDQSSAEGVKIQTCCTTEESSTSSEASSQERSQST